MKAPVTNYGIFSKDSLELNAFMRRSFYFAPMFPQWSFEEIDPA